MAVGGALAHSRTALLQKAEPIMKIPLLLSAAALIAGSQFSVLAEPPPYGPSQDTWGGCVDQLPNVDGIIGVICPARIPVKSLTMPRLVASAKAEIGRASCRERV